MICTAGYWLAKKVKMLLIITCLNKLIVAILSDLATNLQCMIAVMQNGSVTIVPFFQIHPSNLYD